MQPIAAVHPFNTSVIGTRFELKLNIVYKLWKRIDYLIVLSVCTPLFFCLKYCELTIDFSRKKYICGLKSKVTVYNHDLFTSEGISFY